MKMPRQIIIGRVIRGESLGKKFGFPTANLPFYLIKKYRIPFGVYAALVKIGSRRKRGIVIAGVTGKINKKKKKLEVFILNFKKALYNKKIEVEIIKKIRPIIKFKDITQLQKQVKKDIRRTKAILR